VPFLVLIALVPRPIVLPMLCVLALAGAALAAVFAWLRNAQRYSDRVTPWDVAGALALIGFAAGAVSEPDQVLLLFERQSLTQ
jgi:ABC-type Na+ efflux pump permease subunit